MIVSRGVAAVVALALVFGCKKDEPEETRTEERARTTASVAPAEAVAMGATDFCKLVYEAPLRQLEKACSDADKKSKVYGAIVATMQERTQSCWKMLNSGLQNKRLSLPTGTAKRCGEALDKLAWKDTLEGDITKASECRNLGIGLSVAGKPCRSSYECAPGLFCSGAQADADGMCMKRVAAGERCERSVWTLLGEPESSCESGLFCDHGGKLASLEPAPHHNRLGFGDPPPVEEPSGPKGRVRMGGTTVSGRLPPEVIQRIVRMNFGRFRLCYQNGLRTNPNLSGRVTVRFVISRTGTVSSVSGDGDIGDDGVIACVTRAFYGLTFPQPEGGIVTVTYPIVFSPGDAPEETGDAAAPSSLGEPTNTCLAYRKDAEDCRHTRECGGGLSCVVGKCGKPLKAGDTCRVSDDCEDPLVCVDKATDAKPEPTGDGEGQEAPPPERACKAPEASQSCVSHEECPGACVDGQCQPFCGG